nr:MAG: nonstructural protein [Microvirus sp.]
MKMYLYAVYDMKTRVFCIPFFAPNKEVALRSFEYSANHDDNDIGRYPSDFGLYEVGEFDDGTGQLSGHVQPEHLATALHLVKPVEELENV